LLWVGPLCLLATNIFRPSPPLPIHTCSTAFTKQKSMVSQLTPSYSSDRTTGISWPKSLDLTGWEVRCDYCPSVHPGIWHSRAEETLVPIHSSILQSVLRQVRSLFQSEFSTGCDLVLPLSISSIFSILKLLCSFCVFCFCL
jgi:hypothetical protein